MTDQPVYLIANLTVNDAAEYRKYEKGFFPLLKRHGGEFVTYDDNPHTFEGEAPRPGRVIMFRFPSEAHAREWYSDPDYQALSRHRRAATRLEFLTMVRRGVVICGRPLLRKSEVGLTLRSVGVRSSVRPVGAALMAAGPDGVR